ncbi:hypothetical protein SAMN06297397_2241 [Aristaeella lactis]|uniref:Uncharacterized protein n=1 Tax=Aristaeella lactis TaxID=3046383 RepID=A0AC61PN36_9FIRM|nr:hypothetical protein SAMN06297397_2241 [Aristaeella lactis]
MTRKPCSGLFVLLSMILLFSFTCIIPAMAEVPIRKRITELGDSHMDIDVDVLPEWPETVLQMKVERSSFDRNKTMELVKKYSLSPKKGESWVCEIGGKQNPDYELYFCEESGAYGSIAVDLYAPHTLMDETDEGQCKANATTKAFLDELGLDYEYPFYYVAPMGKNAGGVRLIEIVARLTIDGMPCNTTIGWTRDSDSMGDGDPTPGAFFVVTESGELTTAIIRNPVNVIKTKENQTMIKSWNAVLEDNKGLIMEQFGTKEDAGATLTLKQIEFVMMVDAHQIAYPAWAYCFDCYVPADPNSSGPFSYDLLLTYDARTGHEVWRYIN